MYRLRQLKHFRPTHNNESDCAPKLSVALLHPPILLQQELGYLSDAAENQRHSQKALNYRVLLFFVLLSFSKIISPSKLQLPTFITQKPKYQILFQKSEFFFKNHSFLPLFNRCWLPSLSAALPNFFTKLLLFNRHSFLSFCHKLLFSIPFFPHPHAAVMGCYNKMTANQQNTLRSTSVHTCVGT